MSSAMKSVAVMRHVESEGPGYFATFLARHEIPWRLIALDRGNALPVSANDHSGLVFMGGPMSVNDDLPWIRHALHLIRQAVVEGVPVLGHCLGGQLMAKALGAEITRNAVAELGWGRVTLAQGAVAREWFGDLAAFDAFHWHGETFAIPGAANLILSSPHCVNQAFAMGPHLALQCHIEMTEDMVRDWATTNADEVAAASASPAVLSAEQMCMRLPERLAALQKVADSVYGKWIGQLKK